MPLTNVTTIITKKLYTHILEIIVLQISHEKIKTRERERERDNNADIQIKDFL